MDDTWEQINATLRERIRTSAGRDPSTSAGILQDRYEEWVEAYRSLVFPHEATDI